MFPSSSESRRTLLTRMTLVDNIVDCARRTSGIKKSRSARPRRDETLSLSLSGERSLGARGRLHRSCVCVCVCSWVKMMHTSGALPRYSRVEAPSLYELHRDEEGKRATFGGFSEMWEPLRRSSMLRRCLHVNQMDFEAAVDVRRAPASLVFFF